MTAKQKNTAVFVFTILLSILVYVWLVVLNKGTVEITSNIGDYDIRIPGGQTVECPRQFCQFELPASTYLLTISKANYGLIGQNVVIERGKATKAEVELIKTAALTVSKVLPKSKKLPKVLPKSITNQEVNHYAWSEDESLLIYINEEDNRLYKWNAEDGSKVVTGITNVENPMFFISPNKEHLIIEENTEFVFVDLIKSSKKKQVYGLILKNLTWNANTLYANDENSNLYAIDPATREEKDLNIVIDLEQSLWAGDQLVYFTEDENITTISLYNPAEQSTRELIRRNNFRVVDTIYNLEEQKGYFFNSLDASWYELSF